MNATPSPTKLRLAAALAALGTAYVTGWVQHVHLSPVLVAVLTAGLIALAARVFPSLRPSLESAGDDPMAVIQAVIVAAAGALVSWLPGLSDQIATILVGALGLLGSGAVLSARDTLVGPALGRRVREP